VFKLKSATDDCCVFGIILMSFSTSVKSVVVQKWRR